MYLIRIIRNSIDVHFFIGITIVFELYYALINYTQTIRDDFDNYKTKAKFR